MRLSINIYCTSTASSIEKLIGPCLETIDFTPPIQVSRTIGPANYLEIERRLLEDNEETIEPIRQDICRRRIDYIEDIPRLFRQGSVLQIHYTGAKSRRFQEIAEGLAALVDGWYFWSDASFSFGPVDLVRFDEDDEGQDKVELVDVSQFLFCLATDNFGGDPQRLASQLDLVPEMVSFRALLEGILGETKLYLEY